MKESEDEIKESCKYYLLNLIGSCGEVEYDSDNNETYCKYCGKVV